MALTERTEITEKDVGFIRHRRIKPTLCSFSLSVDSVKDNPASAAFSLIEVLVALVIVAMTASVALESQLTSLKLEQKSRALQVYRFETQRIFSAARRVKNEQELMQFLETNILCRVKSEKVEIASGTNVLTFLKHELSTAYLPEFPSVLYTPVTAEKPDNVTNPLRKQ